MVRKSLPILGLVGLGAVGALLIRRSSRISSGISHAIFRAGSLATGRQHSLRATRPGAPQGGLLVLPSRYPKVRRDERVVEELHGVKVADPYRWLEDPDSPETAAFVTAQNKLTDEILAQCETRAPFKTLMTELMDYPKYGLPYKRGGRYYYSYNSGLQQHYVTYTQKTLDAPTSILLDPNQWSEDGTVALKQMAFSDDGSLLAYAKSSGGSDWSTIHLLAVDSEGRPSELPDSLEFVKFSSLAWTHDNKGFFYNRYPDPAVRPADLGTETDSNTNQQLCYHVLGTPQSEDAVVLTIPEHPTWMIGAEVTDDGRYALLYVSEGCLPANRVYLLDLEALPKGGSGAVDFSSYDFFKGSNKLPLVKLVDNFEASYDYVANEGPVFTFKTNLNAPRYRLVATDVGAFAAAQADASPATADGKHTTAAASGPVWTEVLPQHEKDLLQSVRALQGDNLVVSWLRDVKAVLELRSLSTGTLKREFPLPDVGTVTGLSGDRKAPELFFAFQNFTDPGSTYRVDVSSAAAEPALFRRTQLKVAHDPADYVTKQVFVTSKDGTQVPMFIVHRRGLELNGTSPTLLYGYGGFNISLEPYFSASRLAFIRGYDGVFAMANLRGGGEYGTTWRDAGSKLNKQNVFDDFQACAEALIAQRYCAPATLTIQGGSNGGLLVGACANQRPDLYACAIAQVGVLDMYRFHKFTIGHAWITDYGCADNAEEFAYLSRYSPLHNVSPPDGGTCQYPAMILATGDHDDRVVPLHSFKHVATLQHVLGRGGSHVRSRQRNPLLARIEVRAGHGAGKPTTKVIEEAADLFGFAAKCMGATWKA